LALSPQPDEAFLREVDDAVRQDQLLGIWHSYGRLIVGAVIAALLAFGGYLFWDHQRQKSSGEVAEVADKLLQSAASGGAIDGKAIATLADSGQSGYEAIAALSKAAGAVKSGDVKDAIAQYGEAAGNDDLPQSYRDLALVRKVALSFDQMQPQQVVDQLKPLAIEGEPWFGSAGEMSAIAYMKMGKRDLAAATFAALAKDLQVPASIGSRARQMAALLGVDVASATPATIIGEDKAENANADR
jgi:hypothetical protein